MGPGSEVQAGPGSGVRRVRAGLGVRGWAGGPEVGAQRDPRLLMVYKWYSYLLDELLQRKLSQQSIAVESIYRKHLGHIRLRKSHTQRLCLKAKTFSFCAEQCRADKNLLCFYFATNIKLFAEGL